MNLKGIMVSFSKTVQANGYIVPYMVNICTVIYIDIKLVYYTVYMYNLYIYMEIFGKSNSLNTVDMVFFSTVGTSSQDLPTWSVQSHQSPVRSQAPYDKWGPHFR